MKNNNPILFNVIIIALLTIVSISGCKKETDSSNNLNNLPVACFTVDHDTILVFDSVFVNAACSEGAISYSWATTHVDPPTASGVSNYFQPYTPGTFEITLTATNSEGNNSVTKTLFARNFMNYDFAGTYTCYDTCSVGNFGPYTITITANGADGVTITNFFDGGNPVSGTVSNGIMSVNTTNGSEQIQTTGTLGLPFDNKLYLQTNVTNGSNTFSCTTICTRN